MSRALAAARSAPDFAAVTRVGDLLLLVRQGFMVAAAERGEVVYEGTESCGRRLRTFELAGGRGRAGPR